MIDLEAIRKRADAAQAGPWHADYCGKQDCQGWHIEGGPGVGSTGLLIRHRDYDDDSTTNSHDDLAFIIHARADIPALLDHIASLQQQLAEAKEELNAYRVIDSYRQLGIQTREECAKIAEAIGKNLSLTREMHTATRIAAAIREAKK